MMKDKKKLYIDDVFKAAWLGLKSIDPITAVRREGKVRFEVPDTSKTHELLRMYDLRPRIIINEYVEQLKRLSARSKSLQNTEVDKKGKD